MIYLHCGWPKTGTSSLQAALVRNEARLGTAGILYPRRWRRQVDGSHNDLVELVHGHRDSGAAVFEPLEAFLRESSDADVLLSSETLAASLWDGSREGLLDLLATMQKVAPVRCIWTMRRLDEMFLSLYQQLVVAERISSPPLRFMEGFSAGTMFASIGVIENALGGEVAYVKYEPDSGHNGELLRSFGVPPSLAYAIEQEVSTESRLNASPRHKEMVAVLNAEVFASRLGLHLERRTVANVFHSRGGDFSFECDWPCRLVDSEVRQNLHARAVDAARSSGIASYVSFFGEDVIDDSPSSAGGDIEELSESDMRQLEARLARIATDR